MRPTVFLSRPAELSSEQESTFRTWEELLELEFDLERLQRHQYADEPWPQLREIVAGADGVVSFGFRQVTRRGEQGGAVAFTSLDTSPWIHIETALAIALRVPVLAVSEDGVQGGVFEPAVWVESLYGVPAGTPPSRRAIPEQWIYDVLQAFSARSTK